MLKSLQQLPLQVLNLASGDLFYWNRLAEFSPVSLRVISTNLKPVREGTPVPHRYVVLPVENVTKGSGGQLRVGFLGLTASERVRPNSGFEALDPLEALEQVKPAVMADADLLIVLGDLPREVATRLAERHPEIVAVLLTERRFMLHPPEQLNNAVILSGVERGRYMGDLVLEFDPRGELVGYRPQFVAMDENVPEEPSLLSLEKQLANRLGPSR